MSTPRTVLLLGGSGRTGRLTLRQLLERDLRVRAVVRSAAALPPDLASHPRLEVVEASVRELRHEQWLEHVRDRAAVLSCLGHNLTPRGIFGPPRDLVSGVTRDACGAIEALRPAAPVKFVLMTSVSVNGSARADTRRGGFDRAVLATLRALVPPTRDNQAAADHLQHVIGPRHPHIEWCVVRPDSLLEGDVTEYSVHEGIVDSLFAPGSTRMANVAHFMCELVTDPATWREWNAKLPVIVDVALAGEAIAQPA